MRGAAEPTPKLFRKGRRRLPPGAQDFRGICEMQRIYWEICCYFFCQRFSARAFQRSVMLLDRRLDRCLSDALPVGG